MARCALFVVSALFAADVSAAGAQRRPPPATQPGWLPTQDQLFIPAGLLSASDEAILASQLQQIERLFRNVDALGRPVGFEIQLRVTRDAPATTGTVLSIRYSLLLFTPTKAVAGAPCSCIEVVTNFHPRDIHRAEPEPRFVDAEGRRFYLEPAPGGSLEHATLVYEQLSSRDRSWTTVLLTPRRQSPWSTVTRKHLLEAALYTLEGRPEKEVVEFRRTLSETPYQRWIAKAPARKKEREVMLRQLALVDTAKANKARRDLEATELEVAAQLKASEPEDRLAANRVLAAGMPGDSLRNEIARMSRAELGAPAWLENATSMRLVDPKTPGAVRVVTPNPDFYQAARSPIAARGVLVRLFTPGIRQNAAVHRAVTEVHKKLDWQALARMLQP